MQNHLCSGCSGEIYSLCSFGASATQIGKGYLHVSSTASADRELLLTGYIGEIYGLYSSRVYDVMSTLHCQYSAGIWSCSLSD